VTGGNSNTGGPGTNIIDFAEGDGQATVNLNGGSGVLNMAAGISASDVALQTDSTGDLIVLLKDTGESVTFTSDLTHMSWGLASELGTINFADGTSLTVGNTGAPVTFTYFGTLTNTVLVGSNLGSNVFELGAGGDTVTGGNSNTGGPGTNIIDFAEGDGQATVNLNGGSGVLNMAAGISASDVALQTDSTGDLIVLLKDTGESVTFTSDLASNALSTVNFADGTSLILNNPAAPPPLTFVFGAGGESITARNGSNVFDFGLGDGHATVQMQGGTSTLVMGAGITASDVILEADNYSQLTVLIKGTGDSITFNSDLTWTGAIQSELQSISFDDGSSETIGSGAGQFGTFTWIGTSTNTTLAGTVWGPNVFDLGPGGDNITAGFNQGTNNTFNFAEGDGHATVALNGGVSTLNMAVGITASDIILEADNYSQLTVLIKGTGDSITFNSDLTWTGAIQSVLQTINFADGSSETIGSGAGQLGTFTWVGTPTNTMLAGTVWGPNVFDLGPGGDNITAGFNEGTNNTFNFSEGDGHATVALSGGVSTLNMAAGITVSDVILEADNYSQLTVLIKGTGDSITFNNDLSWSGGIQSVLQTINFADGSSETVGSGAGQLGTFTWVGSSSDTSLTGTNYGPNIFDLGPGNDAVTGGNGENTIVYNSSVGHASVSVSSGNSAANKLDFGSALSDESLWFEQSGNDLKIDVLGTTSDITVSNWYSGTGNQLQEITAGSLKLDSQLSSLVAAMATFSAGNPGFDPTLATQMPTDSALQSTIAAAWHS
jgi:hypothetical protein